MTTPVAVLLEDRHFDRASRVEAVQQGASALILMSAAVRRFEPSGGDAPLIGVLLFIPGLVLLVAAIRELRGRGSSHIGWLNLAAGLALLTEWAISLSDGAKILQPTLVAGMLSAGLGLFHDRLQRWRRSRRRIQIDALGLSSWLNPFRRFRVSWEDVESIEAGEGTLSFTLKGGRAHRLPLSRLRNAAEVSRVVLDACRARGIPVRSPAALVEAG